MTDSSPFGDRTGEEKGTKIHVILAPLRVCCRGGDVKNGAGTEAMRRWRGPGRRWRLLSGAGDDSAIGGAFVRNLNIDTILAQKKGKFP